MKKIWLWGAGKYALYAKNCILDEDYIGGIFDNAEHLWGTQKEGMAIYRPQPNIMNEEDILLVTILRYKDVVNRAKDILKISEKQIISFHSDDVLQYDWGNTFNQDKWKDINRIINLEIENEDLNLKLRNAIYELGQNSELRSIRYPIINNGEEALSKVINENKSMCRFGDGEFEIILGRNRAFFQSADEKLGKRLKEVLQNHNDNIVTCIANNYGDLSNYTDEAAKGIRRYLTPNVRAEHLQILEEKEYYDAYISRPYIMYRDKKKAAERFSYWKRLWMNRDVLVIEGVYTRSGCKNDLFAEARSVKRILCPSENAWKEYNHILAAAERNVFKDVLVLIALGPTATVLAYDLALKGYQAIDMGHLDNEYEWYLRQAEEVEDIKYKYVNDYNAGRYAIDIEDQEYENQIIEKIGVI